MRTAADILEVKGYRILSVNVGDTVRRAVETIVANKVGAVVVKDGEAITGIWTERDLLRNTISEGFDPDTTKIETVMTTKLKSAAHDETIYQIMDKFLGLRIRHLLIEKDGKYIGILSSGDIIRACLQDKTEDLRSLKAMVSWEYYEEWKF